MDNNDCAQIRVKTEIIDDIANMISDFWVGTLEYLINMHDAIIMWSRFFTKINNSWAVKSFQKSIVRK